MKKIVIPFVCIVLLLSACAPNTNEGPIQPGEMIGDFLVTTAEDAIVGWEQNCVGEVSTPEESVYTCTAPVGTVLLISTGLYDDTVSNNPQTATPHLEELWSTYTYELSIAGRPVDLQAFGTIEFIHPQLGVIRYWNVAIVSARPGEIVIRDSGVADGEPFAAVTTYKINEP